MLKALTVPLPYIPQSLVATDTVAGATMKSNQYLITNTIVKNKSNYLIYLSMFLLLYVPITESVYFMKDTSQSCLSLLLQTPLLM